MTCICALVKDGHVWMAGDLMGSNGFTKKVYPDSKVFTNGEFIFGYTSSFRMGQILQYNWQQPPRLEGLTDREYLQLDVVESIRSCFSSFGYGIKDGVEDIGGNFLIGYRGCIYEMQNNFSILRSLDYIAVGSGENHAEAVLATLIDDNPDFDPYFCLTKAISVASKFVSSVSEDCTILTTDESFADEEGINDVGLDVDEILTTNKIDCLKKVADDFNIKYVHNIGIEKLREKLVNYFTGGVDNK